jgi:cation diffusion facilitator family transporter
MNDIEPAAAHRPPLHQHIFLGAGHEKNERNTWTVIWLCGAMMILEIAGGIWFGSIALVADGLHMSTHAGAMLLAALAYSFARKHADDPRFSFGTGKLGDLAGFSSAIILAMISLLIFYEAISRLLDPVKIHFREAIPIAFLGLCVNIVSAWLLSRGGHTHDHGHAHGHDHGHGPPAEQARELSLKAGILAMEIFEDGVPPRFRVYEVTAPLPDPAAAAIETVRADGERQIFKLVKRSGFLESAEDVPEPHAFLAEFHQNDEVARLVFEEHAHVDSKAGRDNNMRAALVHVMADAAVSVLVILGLTLAKLFGWLWMDPLAGLIGAGVIASWAFGLIRDTGAILLDMNPDRTMASKIRETIEIDGDTLGDLHLWRLGPGHLGAILAVETKKPRDVAYYRGRLARFHALSHLTIEVSQF